TSPHAVYLLSLHDALPISADAVNECSCQRTDVVFVREIGTRSGSGLTTPRSPTPCICHWGVLADAGSPQFVLGLTEVLAFHFEGVEARIVESQPAGEQTGQNGAGDESVQDLGVGGQSRRDQGHRGSHDTSYCDDGSLR